MYGMILGNEYKLAVGNADAQVALSNGNYPASGSFVDVSKCERFHVIVALGDLADGISMELKIAEAADGTPDSIDATDLKKTFADTDDGQVAVWTVENRKLASDHWYATMVVSGVSGNNYATITYLLDEKSKPVTQTTSVCPSDNQMRHAGDD
jgi:hypothetical protein